MSKTTTILLILIGYLVLNFVVGMIASKSFTGGMWDVDPSSAVIVNATTFTYAFDAEQEGHGVGEWDDDNNESGERPEKVTVRLMANGAESSSMEVAEGAYGLWAFSFDKLPPRDPQGNEIAYSVAADDVPEYTVEVVHVAGNAYRITYTRPTPVKPTLTITAKDQKYTYNGQTQGEGDTAYEDPAQIAEKVTVEGLLEGDELTSVVLDGQGQEVGEYPIEVTGFSINNNPGARDKYDVVLVPGKLTIDPAKATIAVNSASKVAGEADPVFTGTVEGLVHEGDLGEVRYVRTNNDEAPGTYVGVLTATYDENPNYDVDVAKGDFTIRAVYTLRWLDGDESVLQEKTYVEGESAPTYDGREPVKTATAQYTYTFADWDEGTVEGSTTTYRPIFNETVNEYTVTVEGGTADKTTVAVGEIVSITADAPEPGKAFVQWAQVDGVAFGSADASATTFVMPAKDVTVTATFAPIVIGDISDKAYTGSPLAPAGEVQVSLNGVDLHLSDEDFEVTFADNVDVGDAKVTVTLLGARTGVATSTFKITPADISTAVVTVADQTYDGTPREPSPTVVWKGKTLVAGVDYTVSYRDNRKVGTATVVITGVGNYAGEALGTFEVFEKVRYRLVKGGGSTLVRGSGDSASFTFKRSRDDGETIGHFAKLLIDGKEVSTSRYTVKKGSVIVTLKPVLIDSLSVGRHRLTAVFDDGRASGTFTVKAARSDDNRRDDHSKKPSQPATTGKALAQTGDTSLPTGVLAGIASGGIACVVVGIWLRRRGHRG